MRKMITVENIDYNIALNELINKVQTALEPSTEIILDFQNNFKHEIIFSPKGAIHRVSWLTK